MQGSEDDANQKTSRCSKGRVLIASIVVVLCVSGAGLAIYFAVDKPDLHVTPAPGRGTLPEGPSNVSFELSQSVLYIGDKNVSMTCLVSKYAGLRRMDIFHEKDETGTTEIIATISSDSAFLNKSTIALIKQMNADSAILRTVFASALACQDKGRYYCIASGNLVSKKTLELDLLGKPHKPTLLLNRGIVEGKLNGKELPFTCEGDVGYPAGKLVLESHSQNYFFPNITEINTTISNETCRANQKISFYYAFSRSWQGKEIRCSVVNDKSLGPDEIPPFDSQTVQVLPADYCQSLPDRFYYHPYYCHYYIDCVNGSANIEECSAEQCFGLNETSGCIVCGKAKCVPDVVANECSKPNAGEIVSLSDVRCSMYVNCTDKMVHECPENECFNVNNKTCASWKPSPSCKETDCFVFGTTTGQNATIVCPGVDVHVTSVAVTVSPGRNGLWEMFYITGVSGLGVLQGNENATLSLFGARPNQTLSIDLHPLQCSQIGQYIININNAMCGRITVIGRPSKPTLFLSRDIVEGKENRDQTLHTCEGDVGYPAGKLLLESNVTRFFNASLTSVSTTVSNKTCEVYKKITFKYAFSRSWHGQELRCSVVNSLGEKETSLFDAKVVEVVPADSCMDRSDGHYYHQYNCSRFIYCVNRTVHIAECPRTACFGLHETNRCNSCGETKCVRNITGDICSTSNMDELVPYTSIRCSTYANCTDRTMHECPGNECFNDSTKTCPRHLIEIKCSASEQTTGSNATIICTVGEVNVTSVSVKVTSARNVELTIFDVNGVNGPGVLSANTSASLTLAGTGSSQTLSIGLCPLQCYQLGLYSINVNNELGGEINITDNAEAPLIFVTNVNSQTGTIDIVCRGNVGAPSKEIFLEVKFYESTSFHMFSTKNSTNTTLKDCDNERETNFTIIATQNWNNSVVRCSVRNEKSSIQSSDQRRINIVASNVILEPSKGRVYIGDTDFSITCLVSDHTDLKSVEIYHETEKLGTREIIAFVTKQNTWAKEGRITSAVSNITDKRAFLRINFTNVTCAECGIYQCVTIGNVNFTSSLDLDISSEPDVPTLRLSPWIEENKPIFADRMFNCKGMVGRPAGQMFVEANISGSFERYDFPSVIENTLVNCNTNQNYRFYYTFNMSWHGRDIKCAVRNVRTNEITRSPPKTIEVVPGNYCVGKGDDKSYPHPYECTKYIRCNQDKIIGIYGCDSGLCWGMNQTLGCTYCNNQSEDLACLPGARKY